LTDIGEAARAEGESLREKLRERESAQRQQTYTHKRERKSLNAETVSLVFRRVGFNVSC